MRHRSDRRAADAHGRPGGCGRGPGVRGGGEGRARASSGRSTSCRCSWTTRWVGGCACRGVPCACKGCQYACRGVEGGSGPAFASLSTLSTAPTHPVTHTHTPAAPTQPVTHPHTCCPHSPRHPPTHLPPLTPSPTHTPAAPTHPVTHPHTCCPHSPRHPPASCSLITAHEDPSHERLAPPPHSPHAPSLQLMKIQAMNASPFVKPFKEEATKWEATLTFLQVGV